MFLDEHSFNPLVIFEKSPGTKKNARYSRKIIWKHKTFALGKKTSPDWLLWVLPMLSIRDTNSYDCCILLLKGFAYVL